MPDKRKILIIDDELDNRELLEQILTDKFKVLSAEDGEAGLRVARAELPDLILLDITMPKLDGFAVCETLRTNEATRDIPIIMLTAASDVDHRIRSFMTGADDFVPKPFRPKELLARVLSKMRRVEERKGKEEVLECGNLVLDLRKIDAQLNGKSLGLSVLEFNLLKCFVQNKDRVMSRERILESVWRDSVVSDRTVDTHIVSLRKKLADFDHTLATVYGAGYVLKKE
ncbi:MAG: response regulator transcription factor [Deltaproteobacteria bacterium]|nr:response regulator transcription factor [Deltaproteobacteria bacterium]